MRKPIGRLDSLAASGTWRVPGTIDLINARTLELQIDLTYGASIDADTTINIYHSADGETWNNVAYAAGAITYSAGARRSKTFPIDPPSDGHLMIEVVNGSSADVITKLAAWYTIRSWPEGG